MHAERVDGKVVTPDDPIVVEVRKHREEIARESGNDLGALFEHFKKREKEGGRKVVSSARKPTAE